jgi:hypothetical protein
MVGTPLPPPLCLHQAARTHTLHQEVKVCIWRARCVLTWPCYLGGRRHHGHGQGAGRAGLVMPTVGVSSLWVLWTLRLLPAVHQRLRCHRRTLDATSSRDWLSLVT